MEMSNLRLQKLLEMQAQQPGDLFIAYAIAMEHLGGGELEKAKQLFEDVIGSDPHYVPAYYQLGKILEQKGDEENAVLIFEKGLAEAQLRKDNKTVNEFRTAIEELTF